MRPDRDSTRNIGSDRAKPGKKLQDIPKTKKDDSGDRQRKDKDQRKNSCPGIEKHVSAHYARDSAARADGRNVGMQIEEHMQQSRTNPAEQIKE